MPPSPAQGRCARCQRQGPVFPPPPDWGRVPGPLCSADWQKYAGARASDDVFLDWNDAFDNGNDDQLARGLQDF